MEIAAIFFTLAIFILVAMYLYAPFMERRARRVTEEEHELSALLAERDRVVNSLQELDFDFKLGKIPEEDYPTQRAGLLQKGADILRKIDSFSPQAGSVQDDEEARLEKAIAARRADASTAKPEVSDDDVESMISSRRKNRKEKSGGFCPKCGRPIIATDRFCPSCGKSLT